MRHFSLAKRQFISIVALFLVFAAIFIIFQSSREKNYKISLINNRLQEYNILLYRSIDWDNLKKYDGNQLENELTEYTKTHYFHNLRVTILNDSGLVLFDSQRKDYSHIPNHHNRKEINQALEKGMGYDISRQSELINADYFYSATYFKAEHLIIRSALPYSNYLLEQLKTDKLYFYFACIIIIVLITILYGFASRLDKNINKLNLFAQKVATHQSLETSELTDFPKDELGQIAQKIISLYKELQTTKQEQTILKQELTQNVAHELKTPVACIQAYLETILNEDVDEKTKQEFLEKTFKQSQRLSSLLQDISTLNRLDNNAVQNEFEKVSINDILSQITTQTDLQLKQKNMSLQINVPNDIVINGSYSLLYSIFSNLVNNSILYAGENTHITIIANKTTDEEYSFTVYDNGIGVEEKHLARLFERFYRIDKGRSRKMGGTGLGLAIVKNAVEVHGGKISVINRKEGGLEFDFTLRIE